MKVLAKTTRGLVHLQLFRPSVIRGPWLTSQILHLNALLWVAFIDKVYSVLLYIYIFFWNYNTLPSPNREMEIAHIRTYIQSLCFVLALLKENHPKVVQWQITGGKIRWKCFWFEVTSRLSSRIGVCRVHSVSP